MISPMTRCRCRFMSCPFLGHVQGGALPLLFPLHATAWANAVPEDDAPLPMGHLVAVRLDATSPFLQVSRRPAGRGPWPGRPGWWRCCPADLGQPAAAAAHNHQVVGALGGQALQRLRRLPGQQDQVGKGPAVLVRVLRGAPQPHADLIGAPPQLGARLVHCAVVLDRGVQVDDRGQGQAAQLGAEQVQYREERGTRLGRVVQADQHVDRAPTWHSDMELLRPLGLAPFGGQGEWEGQGTEEGAEQPPGERVVAVAAHDQRQQQPDPDPDPDPGQGEHCRCCRRVSSPPAQSSPGRIGSGRGDRPGDGRQPAHWVVARIGRCGSCAEARLGHRPARSLPNRDLGLCHRVPGSPRLVSCRHGWGQAGGRWCCSPWPWPAWPVASGPASRERISSATASSPSPWRPGWCRWRCRSPAPWCGGSPAWM